MEYKKLTNNGPMVSRLCFGALTIGHLQSGLSIEDGAKVISEAIKKGVNFIDTAELYGTYPHIKKALEIIKQEDFKPQHDIVISSKSYAYTYDQMQKSVSDALEAIGRNYIDIFLLHEQTSRLTLKGHKDAIQYLVEAKKEGKVRFIGVSTHHIEVVKAASLIEEIDIIHPLVNMKGIGIADGTAEEMLAAIKDAHNMGKGIYTMKSLAGGHLHKIPREAFNYLLDREYIGAIAVGMQSIPEVHFNAFFFSKEEINKELELATTKAEKKLLIQDWCVACGKCVERCQSKALSIKDEKAFVDRNKCILCGYCGSVCPEFCLKII